ncbi:hypothetical protein Q4574_12985 [Aliiglaciecola sp. 3_MG-2023]|uniref:hypothetical protein n=1 Tax=Aliiglaciecola sp. 3_MG-2023 TaxID=3062644 RepID=UPI0026E39444|nr:hypothetical protein [Aliiglaciecola sp. 3_MG-2023]MDO6694201.1 hypothetical protein [Aliiglaciecola sp. 3_MG-2023]
MFSKFKYLYVVGFILLIAACAPSNDEKAVTLSHGIDESAGGLEAYIVNIANATFYLEKQGGGLSSMLDNDGVDWIGFHNEKGSGWKGEYRGFPNAIHKQDGNYFHAMNAGTDPASSVVEIESDKHVRITFTSDNGKWQGQWDFYPDRCDFTMIQVSNGYQYWVQYEGVPGGEMDKTDFWFNSVDNQQHQIDESFIGDLPSPEWFAFGDVKTSRMLYLLNHQDDEHPDDYVSRPYMTVLGFGRHEKDKFLTTPQTFSIGFIESTAYNQVNSKIKQILE